MIEKLCRFKMRFFEQNITKFITLFSYPEAAELS